MMYEIFPDGRVRADSPDAVLALWMKMKAPTVDVETSVSTSSSIQDSWSIFVKLLSPEWLASQRHVLSILKKQDGPIHRDAFVLALGPAYTSLNVVGGTMAGISRQAKKAGLALATIIIREGMKYRPGPLLRERALPWDDAAQTNNTPFSG